MDSSALLLRANRGLPRRGRAFALVGLPGRGFGRKGGSFGCLGYAGATWCPLLFFLRPEPPNLRLRDYGLLVILAQSTPWAAAYWAKAFSFWMRTARTTLESSARPALMIKSG